MILFGGGVIFTAEFNLLFSLPVRFVIPERPCIAVTGWEGGLRLQAASWQVCISHCATQPRMTIPQAWYLKSAVLKGWKA